MNDNPKNTPILTPAEKRRLLAEKLREKGKKPTNFPLSYAQQRIWYFEQLLPGTPVYNIPFSWRILGRLKISALEQSLNEIVKRQAVLKTNFSTSDGQPVQILSDRPQIEISVQDLSKSAPDDQEQFIEQIKNEESRTTFDLAGGPLIRVKLLKLGEEDHILLTTIHHIVFDGWSTQVFNRELSTIYQALSDGSRYSLPELPIQYPDFAVWQRKCSGELLLEAQLSYWKRKLNDCQRLKLVTDRPRPSSNTFGGACKSFELHTALYESLKELSGSNGVTLFMTMLAALKTLLHHYTAQEDIVIGTDIANRNQTEIEPLLGLFTNTLVMRTDLSGNPTFKELLSRVRKEALEAYKHQDLPFEQLVEALHPARDLSHHPLFDVMFIMQDDPLKYLSLPGLSISPLEVHTGTSKLDLIFFIWEGKNGLRGEIEYYTEIFEESTILRMIEHFKTLLFQIATNPDRRISEIPILGEKETHQLLVALNETEKEYSYDKCLQQLFESQAEKNPNAPAVIFPSNPRRAQGSGQAEGRQVTYRELNERANQLAHHLIGLGVDQESIVGLCLERSVEMIVGLLGILKAGGAYLPLDPSYPKERLAFMLRDANVSVLITQRGFEARLPENGAKVVLIDTQWNEISKESKRNPRHAVSPDNLAYIIYTSGSTGVPKGVAVQHRSVVNHNLDVSRRYGLREDDRVLQFYSISFDGAVEEIFPTLISGATLVLRGEDILAPGSELLGFIDSNEISVVNLPTAYWHEWVKELPSTNGRFPNSLRLVIVGGDKVSPDRYKTWGEVVDGRVRLIDTYGPTETTVISTMAEVNGASRLSIGRPIANTKTYILDKRMHPVPIGVAGELHIGGLGVARGYLNRPDLTAERFLPNPFGDDPGERLYRTGDLARYLEDGNIEFLGRIDHQVKIRGFRVELGEIESMILEHPGVEDTVVVAREDDLGDPSNSAAQDKRLVAYLVPKQDQPGADEVIEKAELATKQVFEWQAVFNELYREIDQTQKSGFYIKGWESSYTGLPISDDEVKDWMDQTVERILALKPSRVLEIGCGGSGLMLLRLAPECIEYCATDVSENAIRVIKEQLSAMNLSLPQLSFVQRAADRFEGVTSNSFTAVLVVSVIQYFPSIEYLYKVLEHAVSAVEPGGFIFVGDVRNYRLLRAFHTSVQLYKAKSSLPAQQLRQEVEKEIAFEKQLTVDPAFFKTLKNHLPKIGHVEILLERGRHHNELTKFRYDVMIHVGPHVRKSAPAKLLKWRENNLTIESVKKVLEDSESEDIVITEVPNARVLHDINACELLRDPDGPQTAESIREKLGAVEEKGVDPEDFWSLSNGVSHVIDVYTATAGDNSCYDVVLRKNRKDISERRMVEIPLLEEEGINLRKSNEYANNPLASAFSFNLLQDLRYFLEQKLPEYSVPSSFVTLDKIPLTPSAKVDRMALPRPYGTRPDLVGSYVAPRTSVEEKLADIWSQVLGVEKVGIYDNFFELGGESIIAIQIISKANQGGLNLTVRHIFQHQTIAELAAVAGNFSIIEADQGPIKGPVPLTPIQQSFFEQNPPDPHHFNQSVFLEIREELDPVLLEKAINYLVVHHDALRMRFMKGDPGWHQENMDSEDSAFFSIIDLSDVSEAGLTPAIEATASELQSGLNISKGPVLKVALFNLGLGKPARLLIIIHHLVVDGVSWRILLEDLLMAYTQLSRGKEITLPPKTTSFKRWAERLKDFAESEPVMDELNFWTSPSGSEVNRLPIDRPGGTNTIISSQSVSAFLDAEETQKLLKEVPQAYNTHINDLLLTALVQALSPWTGKNSLLIDLEGHGREELFDDVDISRTVGWFTTIFPLLLSLEDSNDLSDIIKSVKEQVRRIPNHGIGYGLLRHMRGDIEVTDKLRDLPQAEICFNYLGQFDQLLPGSAPFGRARESSGPNASLVGNRKYILEINCGVLEGKLHMVLTYSENLHRRATIEELAERYMELLRQLLEYCLSDYVGGYTPSDFPGVDLNQEELDKIITEIGE